MYFLFTFIKPSLLLTILGLSNFVASHARIPFPQLRGSDQTTQIQILSEVTREGETKYMLDEYVNFKSSSQRIAKTTFNDQYGILIDGSTSSILKFKPYNCELMKRVDLVDKCGFNGMWLSDFKTGSNVLDKINKSYPIVGVSAIWLNAANKASIYSKLSTYKHSWIFVDTEMNSKITLIFDDQDFAMRLSSIEFMELKSNKILSMINVIGVMYKTMPEKVFNFPVVFNCGKILKELGFESIVNDENDGSLEKINIHTSSSYEINMEISATSFTGHNEMKTKTDVIDLTVAGASLEDLESTGVTTTIGDSRAQPIDVRLVHARGFSDKTSSEIKQIFDYTTHVKYLINGTTNECTIEKLGSESQEMSKVTFKNNNFALTIDDVFVKKLLEDSADFILIKRWVTQDKTTEYLYYEREESDSNPMFGGKQTTISKTYSRACNDPASEAGDGLPKNNNPAYLERIKVTTYNEDRSKIEDTYSFMVTSYKTGMSLSERAKLFDISVCFEQEDKHKWIRIKYPLDRRNIPELANYFYKQHSNRENLQLNFLRVPKIEQTYEDYYVVMRALLLDTRPDPFVQFDSVRELSFKESNPEELHIAPNLKQCSDICKMYNCHMFAYCVNHECKVTTKSETLTEAKSSLRDDEASMYKKRLRRDWSCSLYIEDTSYTTMLKELDGHVTSERIKMRPLNDILAQLSHDEYFYYHPSMELEDKFEYKEIVADDKPELTFRIPNFWTNWYGRETLKFDEEKEMVPISMDVEGDPADGLFSFGLAGEQDSKAEAEVIGPAFHDSIGRRRFKIDLKALWQRYDPSTMPISLVPMALVDPEGAKNIITDDAKKGSGLPNDFIVINGQSYDECALLCIDRGADCGSFSYCYFDGQCTTSGLYDRKSILDITEDDSQCVIVQRDFLAKFSRLEEPVSAPEAWAVAEAVGKAVKLKKTWAHDEHDCAHQCMLEPEFNCLSFDYCPDDTATVTVDKMMRETLTQQGNNNNLGNDAITDNNDNHNVACFLRATRKIDEQPVLATNSKLAISNRKRKLDGTCWRHQRSYLADFNRLDHRGITGQPLDELQTVSLAGATVDECARQCAENYKDCNMFQFCYDANSNPHQLCSVAVTPVVRLTKSSLNYEANCYIYTRKKDIAYRNNGDKQQPNDQVLIDDTSEQTKQKATNLSVPLILCLTVITFFVSLIIGASIVLQNRYRDQIEQRYRRFKARWLASSR